MGMDEKTRKTYAVEIKSWRKSCSGTFRYRVKQSVLKEKGGKNDEVISKI